MIAAAVVAAAVPLLSGPEAYRLGLEKVCLAAVLHGAPPAASAAELKLQPLPDKLLPNRTSPGDRGWYLPTRDVTLAIAWADGSCSVQMVQGDALAAYAQMQPLLRPLPEHFRPGEMGAIAPGLFRISYCEAKRPHPTVVTFVTNTPDHPRRPVASSTVFRSLHDDEPPQCVLTPLK